MISVNGSNLCADDKSWSTLRRLHMARRVERSLLSYERSGWLDDTTIVTKHSEIRPSSEMGPIICCLDTSGSMHGARETVAKVKAIEHIAPGSRISNEGARTLT